jgi:hypothetical protein
MSIHAQPRSPGGSSHSPHRQSIGHGRPANCRDSTVSARHAFVNKSDLDLHRLRLSAFGRTHQRHRVALIKNLSGEELCQGTLYPPPVRCTFPRNWLLLHTPGRALEVTTAWLARHADRPKDPGIRESGVQRPAGGTFVPLYASTRLAPILRGDVGCQPQRHTQDGLSFGSVYFGKWLLLVTPNVRPPA